MPRWVWFVPFGALVLALAVWGFRLGWIRATITETHVIEAYAARYLEIGGDGARITDCSAQPGQVRAVWLIVTCTGSDAVRFDFPVDRMGRLLKLAPDPQRLEAPET